MSAALHVTPLTLFCTAGLAFHKIRLNNEQKRDAGAFVNELERRILRDSRPYIGVLFSVMRIVWHEDGLWEVSWIRYLLRGIFNEEVFDSNFLNPVSGIHVLRFKNFKNSRRYFNDCFESGDRNYLFHVGDEWLDGPYHFYGGFDGVIRNYAFTLLQRPGILTVPLGQYVGTQVGLAGQPLGERRYAWAFLGEIKASRAGMIAALEGINPNFILRNSCQYSDVKRSSSIFDTVMGDAIFAPCPMGTINIETGRLYEAMEFGCIPILECRRGFDYYRDLFGSHPIPSFESWEDAGNFMSTVLASPGRADELLHEIRTWWHAKRKSLSLEIGQFLTGPSWKSSLKNFAHHPASRSRILHGFYQAKELLHHQERFDARRVKRILQRSFLKGPVCS